MLEQVWTVDTGEFACISDNGRFVPRQRVVFVIPEDQRQLWADVFRKETDDSNTAA